MIRPLTILFERWTAGERNIAALLFGLIALPLSWVYRMGLIAFVARRKQYPSTGTTRLIVVSSPLVGGVGKTPLAMGIIHELTKRQQRVCAVTMGYGRRLKGRASFYGAQRKEAEDVGDEGMEIGLSTGVSVHVGHDPAVVIDELARTGQYDWIVFDDGVSRSWDEERRVVVVSADVLSRPVRYLPLGRWRTGPEVLSRAKFVAVTSKNQEMDRSWQLQRLRTWGYAGPIGWYKVVVTGINRPASGRLSQEAVPPAGPAFLFCGIASPQRFVQTAVEKGIQVAGTMTFPDHHPYAADDTGRLEIALRSAGARWFLTTMKDLMRLPHAWRSAFPVYTLETTLCQFSGDDLVDVLIGDS